MIIKTTHQDGLKGDGSYDIPSLPLAIDLETKAILKKNKDASRALAELKGVALSMPNKDILINTLSLQEAKESSAIENIITPHDDLYKSDEMAKSFVSIEAKEVYNYATVLKHGFLEVKEKGFITNNIIIKMQSELEGNNAGFRTQSGTTLKNERTGNIVYTPPQSHQEIVKHMSNLESFINNDDLSDLDALIKMAIIHHQFESIHPFFDGNGRTGRIINVLYLVKQGLLDTPILYLSRYINKNKPEYYELLQQVREHGKWEDWVLFMLDGIIATSYQTIDLINNIKALMQDYKHKLRSEEPKIYSQYLLNNLFYHPYTKTSFLETELGIHRNTATKYLDKLVNMSLLSKHKIGKESFYVNDGLYKLLENANK